MADNVEQSVVQSVKFGVWGFWLSLLPIILFLGLFFLYNNPFGENVGEGFDVIIIPLFIISLLSFVLSLFFCVVQLRRKKTKLAIAGLIITGLIVLGTLLFWFWAVYIFW